MIVCDIVSWNMEKINSIFFSNFHNITNLVNYCCCYLVTKSHPALLQHHEQQTVCQTPLSVGFPRQKYRSGFPFPSPGDLPSTGIKLTSPALAGRFFTTEPSGKSLINYSISCKLATLCNHFPWKWQLRNVYLSLSSL